MEEKEVKIERIKDCVAYLMKELDIKYSQDNEKTPYRIASMLVNELFVNVNNSTIDKLHEEMTLFKAPNSYPIEVVGIKFNSTCEHHWLPFSGYADIRYIPDYNIIGLSKIPRVVKYFSKKPQVQERLTQEIGDFLVETLQPKFLSVVLRDVRHACVEVRGIESECTTDTEFEYKKREEFA